MAFITGHHCRASRHQARGACPLYGEFTPARRDETPCEKGFPSGALVLPIGIVCTEPMKRLLVPLLALAVSCGGTARAQEGRLKVATVDMQALFQTYHKTKETRDAIQKDVDRVKEDQKDRIAKLQELEKSIGEL